MREIPGRGYLFSVLLFLVISFPAGNFAQQKKIIKIIDTNLYELEDGSLVQLAGIEMPVKDIPGEKMQDMVEDILNYADLQFKDTKIEIISAGISQRDSRVTLVYIIKHYPLSSADLNRQCLELGFGRFRDNADNEHREEYKKAEESAIKKGRGLWSFRLPEVKDTLDRKYYLSEIDYYNKQDYANYLRFLRKKGPNIPSQILGETLMGAIGGMLGVIPGGLAAYALTNKQHPDPYVLIGGISLGYTLGVCMGVCSVAETANPEISFSYTFGFSSLCMFAGAGLAATSIINNKSAGYELLLLPLVPLVSSIVYVNGIAPNPVREEGFYGSSDGDPLPGGWAFKDIYNSTLQYRCNLFSIPL